MTKQFESRLMYVAAARGDVEQLKEWKSEMSSFVTPGTKNTILHVYIISQSRGKDEHPHYMAMLTQVLEKLRSNITGSQGYKDKKLSVAAVKNVGAMLDCCPFLLWKVNEAGDTPLHMAARHGQAAIVQLLINRARDSDAESAMMGVGGMLHMVNKEKETALHQAVRYQHNKVVWLLVREDDPCYEYSPNEDGETPLYMAAERGNSVSVEMIVEIYHSPAYQGPQGATALHAAAALHSWNACNAIVGKQELMFLTREVDERGRTPLHYGGICLLGHDPSAAFVKDKEGKTALHVLAGKGYDWMVSEFFKYCPECLDVEDNRGRNALHYAVESGDKNTVELILKSEYLGDLLKKKDKEGLTPLHLLALYSLNMPDLINDPRLDKIAYNITDLTPSEVVLSTSDPNLKIDVQLDDSLRKAGIKPGWRSLVARSEPKIINSDDHKHETDTNNVTPKPKPLEGGFGEDNLKEERQNHLVVAALIATVTFAAGFTLPGGYNQDQKDPDVGQAVLRKQKAFQAFVILNTLAMVLSSVAVFIHLLIAMNKNKLDSMAEFLRKRKPKTMIEEVIAKLRGKMMEVLDFFSTSKAPKRDTMLTMTMIAKIESKMEVSDLFSKALLITLIAIVAMVLAFIAGTYAVLSHARVLAVAACVVGSLFFGLFWYLWKKLFTLSKNVLQIAALVLCGLVLVLCGLVLVVVTVFIIGPIALIYIFLQEYVVDPIHSFLRKNCWNI